MNAMSFVDAEAYLQTGDVQETVLHRFKLEILQALCAKFGLSIKATGKRIKPFVVKRDYIDALIQYHAVSPYKAVYG